MAVITVSKTLGAGGEEISRRLAERLQIPLLDREIIRRAASIAGVSERSIQDAERVPSLLERMVELLGRYPTDDVTGVPAGVLESPSLNVESYRRLIEDLLRNIAEAGDAVIVGHAAQVILKNFPKTLSVLIYAPLATSVKRLMAEEGLRPNEAEKRIREFNRNREEYLRLYYGVRWLDPELYDLILNTEMLGIEGGTAVILEAVRAMERK